MNGKPPLGETNTTTLLTDLQNRILRLTQIIEGTDIAPWELNLQTGETIFSKRWAQMIGYELHELVFFSQDYPSYNTSFPNLHKYQVLQ